MQKRWGWMLGGCMIFAAGFYAGGFFGAHRLWAITEPMMRLEVEASLNFGIDELLWLRTGNSAKALRRMEQRLDGSILGLARDRAPKELSREERQSLLLAKRYRSHFPFEEASPEAQAQLSAMADEPLDPKVLLTAARALLTEAEAAAMKAELANHEVKRPGGEHRAGVI